MIEIHTAENISSIHKQKANIQITNNTEISCCLRSLCMLFLSENYDIYLVGGCVRDALLERPCTDIDLCTNATPDEMKALATKNGWNFFETGVKHGTLTFLSPNLTHSFEVTTYRIDGKYSDNRHPDEVTFTPSLEEDLKRRDFTINAFAYDYLNNNLLALNPSQNLDLKLGIIRCVGDPNLRFQEDALRMLRAIRFAAQLGFSIEKNTFEAIKDNASLIQNISMERIRDELTKLICSDNPQMLELLVLTGLSTYIMPDLDKMLACNQHNKYHYTDVLHHTFDVMKFVPKDSTILRWSALFHDMGKTYCISTDEDGWEHFFDHADISADMAMTYMQNLKFDNDSIDLIDRFVKYHDREIGGEVSNKVFKKVVNLIGVDEFPLFMKLRLADALAHRLNVGTNFAINSISSAKERYEQLILTPQPMKIKDLALNGTDLKDMGLIGVQIGDTLKTLLEFVLEHPEKNNKEDLIKEVEGKQNA